MALRHAAGLTYDPKSWAAGVWTPKSGSARSALKGIRQSCEVALRHAAGLTYDPKSWAAGVWTPPKIGSPFSPDSVPFPSFCHPVKVFP
ncbi:hypothetical protein D9754_15645 [Planomicrobium sp. Y74]|nr:hypothetical protein D9754_15645 [Planomicrobium sp. Y74]